VTWRVGDAATAVAVSRDGRYVATGTRSGVVCLRRVADGALLHCLIAHAKAVSAIDFSIDRLATASWAGDVAVWELPSLASAGRKQIPGSANDVAFSPDGSALAVATSGAPPVRTPAIERRERRDGYRSPDPSALIQVWGQRGDDVVCRGHAGAVTAVVWTPDGRGLLSGSWDRSVRLWDPRSGRERDRIAGLRHIVRDVAAGGGGRWAAAAAWALGDGEPSSLLLDLLYTAD
jgi:WD40 repeat protein